MSACTLALSISKAALLYGPDAACPGLVAFARRREHTAGTEGRHMERRVSTDGGL